MAETKERMKKACPTLHELADRTEDAITLLNELREDYNKHVADVTAKMNDVIARIEDLATKYAAHIAVTSHPDAANVLTATAVTDIPEDNNLVTSPAVKEV
jgi:flagellar hook-associated protein FlgK